MSCEYGDARLDDYFDQQLNSVQQAALLAHCRRCAVCREAVDQHTQYLLRLKQFKLAAAEPAPQPRRVAGNGASIAAFAKKSSPSRSMSSTWLRAAAAVGALAVGLTWHYTQQEPVAEPSDALWSKVNIVIQVPADLNDAKLTVSLPQGVYVLGQEGMQTLAWNTDFVRGTNALELPIVVDGAFDRSAPQYLDATLEYQGASKTFEFLVGAADNVTL